MIEDGQRWRRTEVGMCWIDCEAISLELSLEGELACERVNSFVCGLHSSTVILASTVVTVDSQSALYEQ